MSFLNPIAALFALTLPVIVILYLLKLKRQPRIIASTLLWRKSIEDLIANAPFQKLRRNLLLYLQLLIAALLVLALMRPILKMTGARGKKYIVLIDASASMKTADEEAGRTRLEQAQTQARSLIEEMSRGDTMTLLSFSNRTRILQNFTADKELLKRALSGIAAEDTATDVSEALLIADSLAKPEHQAAGEIEQIDDAAAYDPRARIVIISDGNLGETRLALTEAGKIAYLPVGKSGENFGITDLDIAMSLDGTGKPLVFAGIKNFGEEEGGRLLRILVNNQPADIKSIRLKGGEEEKVRFRPFDSAATGAAAQTTSTIQLELSPAEGGGAEAAPADHFAVDDRAFGVLAPPRPLKILLVSHGNFFIERLLGLAPNTEVQKLAPDQYRPLAGFDIVIFDNYAPPALTAGNYMFLNRVPQGLGFNVGETHLERPLVIDWNRVHLLTRYVNFEGLQINRALRVEAPAWTRTLVEAPGGPLILTFNREQINALVVTFDPGESDWPLRPSFPIFISNALRWLSESQLVQEQPVLRTGTVLPLIARAPDEVYTIVTPDGRERRVEMKGQTEPFSQTTQAGFYQLSSNRDPEKKVLAFNLLSIAESAIAPRSALQLGREVVEREDELLKTNQEIWKWLIWTALAVLLLEWYIYCRRSWA